MLNKHFLSYLILGHVHDTKKMLQELGFTINMNKSVFTPSKSPELLEFIVDSENMRVHLSKEKIKLFRNAQECYTLMSPPCENWIH